jgi:hypothetical protein
MTIILDKLGCPLPVRMTGINPGNLLPDNPAPLWLQ